MSQIDLYWLRNQIEKNLDDYMLAFDDECYKSDTDDYQQGIRCVLCFLSDLFGIDFARKFYNKR